MLAVCHGLAKSSRYQHGHVNFLSSSRRGLICSKNYATNTTPPKDVAVLGGGITGLATAYYISQSIPSARISIYEGAPRLGGWLLSKKVQVDDGEVLFEAGPRTLRPAGNGKLASRLSYELGLDNDLIFTSKTAPAATNRYVYYPDHLVKIPMPSQGLFSFFKTLLTEPLFAGLPTSLLMENLRFQRDLYMEDESVGDFVSRRLGSHLADSMVSAVLHGIYAGDIYQLSAKSLLSSLWRDEFESKNLTEGVLKRIFEGSEYSRRDLAFEEKLDETKSVDEGSLALGASVFTWRNGLQQLADGLVDALRKKDNVIFQTSSSVSDVVKSDEGIKVSWSDKTSSTQECTSHSHVISALSPGHLGGIVQNASLAYTLGQIPAVSVMTVNLYFRTPDLHPPGFGYLIPLATPIDQNPERALGVVFDTAYAPPAEGQKDNGQTYKDFLGPAQDTVAARGTKLTVMLGGHYWSDWSVFPSEDEGLEMAKSILRRHLDITEEPAAFAVNMQKNCIPQYTVGHSKRVKNAHDKILNDYDGRLRVVGNWARGVGVNDCLRSAWDVAQELQEGGKTGLEPAFDEPHFERIKSLPKWLKGKQLAREKKEITVGHASK